MRSPPRVYKKISFNLRAPSIAIGKEESNPLPKNKALFALTKFLTANLILSLLSKTQRILEGNSNKLSVKVNSSTLVIFFFFVSCHY